MSETQAYTTEELENLLQAVTVEALEGRLAESSIWIDETGPTGGRKAEPYARVNARGRRRSTGLRDYSAYADTTEEGAEEREVTETTTKDRVVECFIDTFGAGAAALSEYLADQLETNLIREMFWAKGVGLLQLEGPGPVPYNENRQRKEASRLTFKLSVSETKDKAGADYIEFVELVNTDGYIPTQTIQLLGGDD